MTLATIDIAGDVLTLRCPDARAEEVTRRLAGAELERVAGWSDAYRRALLTPDKADLLRALGREMLAWVDGERGWLRRMRGAAREVLHLEIGAPACPSPVERAFLEAPWEILADSRGHLAERDEPLFVPYRRLGPRGEERRPSDRRLQVLFMAAAPDGVAPLFYEEEEAAIVAAAEVGAEVVVEESGSLRELARRLWTGYFDVLHVSSHGTSDERPRLHLEDELGRGAPASAADLAAALDPACGARLLFLSACLSGDPHAVTGSLAAAMTERGWPAVLGWGGSVSDAGATRFANMLYGGLSRGQRLEDAVARARADLLHHASLVSGGSDPPPTFEPVQRAWHLARLYLGPRGGGPIAARAPVAAEAKGASDREIVGRRRHLQAALREVQSPTRAGLLFHGFAGHGKSSLAARVAERLPGHAAVVLRGRCDWPGLVEVLRAAVPALSIEPAPVDEAEQARRLRCALEGAPRPVLLVLDDLDGALAPLPASGLPELRPEHAATLRALIVACDGARAAKVEGGPGPPETRLIVTSRSRFALPSPEGDLADRLVPIPVGAMTLLESRKQAQAWARRAGPEAAVRRDRCYAAAERSMGNPALLERLLARVHEETWDETLHDLEAHLTTGAPLADAALRDFVGALGVEPALRCLTRAERELLRASTLLHVPAPLDIFAELERGLGLARGSGRAARLLALGLLDGHRDPLRPEHAAARVSPFVRPRLEPLEASARRELAGALVKRLGALWEPAWTPGPGVIAEELTRLALEGRAAGIARRAAEHAVRGVFARDAAADAANMGRDAVDLIDDQGLKPTLGLLQVTAEACARAGEVDDAQRLFDRALAAAKTAKADPETHAALLVAHARFVDQQGRPRRARAGYDQALALLAGDGFVAARAAIEGEIAGMVRRTGELDEALAIHRRALAVFEGLGDTARRAGALSGIAAVLADQGDTARALEIAGEALALFERSGDLRAHAVTQGQVARLLRRTGSRAEARKLHLDALETHEAAGDQRERAFSLRGLAEILVDEGEVDRALALRREALQIFEALSDRRERAATMIEVADLLDRKGVSDRAAALRAQAEGLLAGMAR